MSALYLEALGGIAASFSVLMARAVQQRVGNSGWVDTIWPISLGLVGAGSALWPVEGVPSNARAKALSRPPVADQPVVPAAAGMIPARQGAR